MPGSPKRRASSSRWVAVAIVLGCAAVAVAPAQAARKAITVKVSKPLSSGPSHQAHAVCPRGMAAVSGGFGITPRFDPHGTTTSTGGTGKRALVQGTRPLSARTWIVTASSFAASAPDGTVTAYARCLPHRHLFIGHFSAGMTLDPGEVGSLDLIDCTHGHVAINGGYATQLPFEFGDDASSGLLPLESQMLSTHVWGASAGNIGIASATFYYYTSCLRASADSLKLKMGSTPVLDNARTSATAHCPKRTQMISGGFEVLPRSPDLAVSVDQNRPKGNRSWSAGLFEFSDDPPPADTTLTAYAYCLKR